MAELNEKVWNEKIYIDMIRFAKGEQERRKDSPVLVRREDYIQVLKENPLGPGRQYFLVAPELGFSNRTHRLWVNKMPPGAEMSAEWKTLGHRHTVEAVIYWLSGTGYSIIGGERYDWKAGDIISVPQFAWHRHLVTSDDYAEYLATTTTPLSAGIGQAIFEDERFPQYHVFAQQGEEALKSLIPGGPSNTDLKDTGELSDAGRLYLGEVHFAAREEVSRRKSRVVVRPEEMVFEATAMGRMAYLVDYRIGFFNKVLASVMLEVAPGRHSGSHRHLYDEINYVVAGEGKVVIDDKTYEVKEGDALAIPVFAWHQYFNTGSQPVRFLCHSTRPAMENLGLALTQHGEHANY